MFKQFLNILIFFFLFSSVPPILSVAPSDEGKLWQSVYDLIERIHSPGNGHKNVEKLFGPICGELEPKNELEIFIELDMRQPFFDKLAKTISEMPLPSNTATQQQKKPLKSENKTNMNKLAKMPSAAIFHQKYDGDNKKMKEILTIIQNFNNYELVLNLHKLMGAMGVAKKMLGQNESQTKIIEFVRKIQTELKSTLELLAHEIEQNINLKTLAPLKMDIPSMVKEGAELINLRLDGGDKCQIEDKEKEENNQRNTFRLLYTFANLEPKQLMEVPRGKDRRRRRRKRQGGIGTIIIVFAIVCLIILGLFFVCKEMNKCSLCKEDSGGGGANNA